MNQSRIVRKAIARKPLYTFAEPPMCIQVEPTEGCNLRCSMCGLKGIRTADQRNHTKLMSLKLATDIAQSISVLGWTSRIEFAMHGEPTLNPDIVKVVSAFRSALPKNTLIMVSNGQGLLSRPAYTLEALFNAGLNAYALDCYKGNERAWNHILYNTLESGTILPHYYPEEKNYSPHQRWKHTDRVFICVRDIRGATGGTHATLNNHCGCGLPPNSDGAGKRCAKPFRELAIRWNGRVAVCCNDFRGELPASGLVVNTATTLYDTWNSSVMEAARRHLLVGNRDFFPCNVCDATSYRVGLLPDKLGKQTMLPPDAQTRTTLRSANAMGPLTRPTDVPWEPELRDARGDA